MSEPGGSHSEAGSSDISDSEIFRRKLLMDGEGMGDNRNIDTLLNSFIQWCDAKDQTNEEITEGYEKLMLQLDHVELSSRKSALARSADARQIEEYDKMHADLEKQVVAMEEAIAQKRLELKEAKKDRFNKMKYDALGRIVSSMPNRKEIMEQMKKIEDDIEIIKAENEVLQEKTDEREKHLRVLVTTARELKNRLREEEEDWESPDSD